MTLYYGDVASYQRGIDLAGMHAVCAKATEGPGYVNPEFGAFRDEAAKHRTWFFAYHFLHQGAAASPAAAKAQAVNCHRVAGGLPVMVDFEPAGASLPSLADCVRFIDSYRDEGGLTHLVYLPHWYWSAAEQDGGLGSPSLEPLKARGMALVSSHYTTYTDKNSGAGWQPYGGMTPLVWQYTSSLHFGGMGGIDFNAFRGNHPGDQSPAGIAACMAELKTVVRTGRLPARAPEGPVRHVVGGANRLSLWELAAARHTHADHLIEVSTANLSEGNKEVLHAYLALANALQARGRPRPELPEGLVYYTAH